MDLLPSYPLQDYKMFLELLRHYPYALSNMQLQCLLIRLGKERTWDVCHSIYFWRVLKTKQIELQNKTKEWYILILLEKAKTKETRDHETESILTVHNYRCFLNFDIRTLRLKEQVSIYSDTFSINTHVKPIIPSRSENPSYN